MSWYIRIEDSSDDYGNPILECNNICCHKVAIVELIDNFNSLKGLYCLDCGKDRANKENSKKDEYNKFYREDK